LAVAIRLTRVGATKRPAYRVIAIDKRRSRDGRALEILGFYDPLTEPATVQLDTDKINAWIGKGALPSETVQKLMRQADAAAKGDVSEKPKRATRAAKPSKKALAKAAAESAPASEPEAETAPAAAAADEVVTPAPEVAEVADEAEAATPEGPESEIPPATEETPDEPVAEEPAVKAPGEETDAAPVEAPTDEEPKAEA
jgi:small subunit ribosomal protein S16